MSILLDDPATHSVPDDDRRLTLAELLASRGCHRAPAYVHENDPVAANRNGSDKQTLTRVAANPSGSDNLLLSSRTGVEELLSQLIAARRARGNRKAIRRPSVAKREERRSGFDRVNLHMRRLSRRVLNDRTLNGAPIPDHETLRLAMHEYITTELGHFLVHREPGSTAATPPIQHARLVDAASDRLARSAASYVLRSWSPDYIAEQRRRGAVGGRASRRRPTWTPGQLADLQALEGLTVAQQAAQLGLNSATIKRMRSTLRQRDTC